MISMKQIKQRHLHYEVSAAYEYLIEILRYLNLT